MGYVAVRDELYRAIVVEKLLLGDDIGVVAMNVAIDAYDASHYTRHRAQVVRNHNDSHTLRELLKQVIEFVLKPIIDKIGGFVKHQYLRVGDDGATEHNSLKLTSREFSDGAISKM